jgi:hypothetical protein
MDDNPYEAPQEKPIDRPRKSRLWTRTYTKYWALMAAAWVIIYSASHLDTVIPSANANLNLSVALAAFGIAMFCVVLAAWLAPRRK